MSGRKTKGHHDIGGMERVKNRYGMQFIAVCPFWDKILYLKGYFCFNLTTNK
jgi:hypothetical protein